MALLNGSNDMGAVASVGGALHLDFGRSGDVLGMLSHFAVAGETVFMAEGINL